MKYEIELRRAQRLANIADDISRRYYRSIDLRVTTKPDRSPVTAADLEVEQSLSEIVTKEFKEGYLGEEGTSVGENSRIWVVDPIDGTLNFLRGMPIWCTLIALVENDVVIASVVTAPALGRRWWATKGGGAWTKDVDGSIRQLNVSGVDSFSNAFFLTGELYKWDDVPTGLDAMLKLLRSADRHLALGDIIDYMLVAEGAADAFADGEQKYWDMAAPSLIITEAGGSIWTSATADTPPGAPRLVVGTNGLLEAHIRQSLQL